MHKDIVDTDLQRTDTSALVLLSIAMMSEKHPESIDLQSIDFKRLASTNRDIHDVLENAQSRQSKQIGMVSTVILDPSKDPMEDFKYLKNKNLLGLYYHMVESNHMIDDERKGATYVGADPLNIFHLKDGDDSYSPGDMKELLELDGSEELKPVINTKSKEKKPGILGKLKKTLNMKM